MTLTERDVEITRLISQIREAKTMARRDFLFEDIIKVWETPVTSPKSSVKLWVRVTNAGQVKVGDKLKFNIGDREYRETAKQILNAGTDKEEVIYHMRENFYFITSMVVSGFSNHKCVEVLSRTAKSLSKSGKFMSAEPEKAMKS